MVQPSTAPAPARGAGPTGGAASPTTSRAAPSPAGEAIHGPRWPWTLVAAVLLAGCGGTERPTPPAGPPAGSAASSAAQPAPEQPTPAAPPLAASAPAAPEPPPPAPPPPPTDDGSGCTMERIRATVAPRLPAVTACYRAAAHADPSLMGRLSVELGIERDGRLVNRSVRESPFPLSLNRCVLDALEGLEFSGRFEKPCIVVYPFVLSASAAP